MEKLSKHHGKVLPLVRDNIDTDIIIPKQYLKAVERINFGNNLFDEWRYLQAGKYGESCHQRNKNKEFILNHPHYQQASILLTGKNFGCGSSREHAVWAIIDYGFRVVIAESFADIFYSNAVKNGLLCVALPKKKLQLIEYKIKLNHLHFMVDLEKQVISCAEQLLCSFEIDPEIKNSIVNGLDDLKLSLEQSDDILKFAINRRKSYPWFFNRGSV